MFNVLAAPAKCYLRLPLFHFAMLKTYIFGRWQPNLRGTKQGAVKCRKIKLYRTSMLYGDTHYAEATFYRKRTATQRK